MKRRFLLPCLFCLFAAPSVAQEAAKSTGYIITPGENGGRGWRNIRLVDTRSGSVLKTIYAATDNTIEVLNARTGAPVAKKDLPSNPQPENIVYSYTFTDPQTGEARTVKRTTTVYRSQRKASYDHPFATSSAACAFDKKNQRLYYTPMGIAELRYIDLKAKTPRVFYLEGETFGAVTGTYDAGAQITRMVFGADGNGYALSNNGEHLIRFTTGKNITITDLGALTDDAANGQYSIHHRSVYGGDMVAGKSGQLYLVAANRRVFKINITEKTATYLGTIKGLPEGFLTNGAMAEEGQNVIVCSSEAGSYYRFNLQTLQAEKVSSTDSPFTGSDLANGSLLADKEEKKPTEQPPAIPQPVNDEIAAKKPADEIAGKAISVYPNPVSGGEVNIAFNNFVAGKYVIQVNDFNGRLVSNTEVNVYGGNQVTPVRLPASLSKGSYLIKVLETGGKALFTEKIVVQ